MFSALLYYNRLQSAVNIPAVIWWNLPVIFEGDTIIWLQGCLYNSWLLLISKAYPQTSLSSYNGCARPIYRSKWLSWENSIDRLDICLSACLSSLLCILQMWRLSRPWLYLVYYGILWEKVERTTGTYQTEHTGSQWRLWIPHLEVCQAFFS